VAKSQVKTQKISEESLSKKEAPKEVEKKDVMPVNQDLEKNDYQNHPKFSKFNHAGGL
jgi:hypothetical protein